MTPRQASAPVHQQAEGSGDWCGLRLRLVRRGRGSGPKIGGVDEQLMSLRIERHIARAKFRFHSFDDAELVGAVFVEDVQGAFTPSSKEKAGFRVVDVGGDYGSDGKGLPNFADVGVHDGQELIATADDET